MLAASRSLKIHCTTASQTIRLIRAQGVQAVLTIQQAYRRWRDRRSAAMQLTTRATSAALGRLVTNHAHALRQSCELSLRSGSPTRSRSCSPTRPARSQLTEYGVIIAPEREEALQAQVRTVQPHPRMSALAVVHRRLPQVDVS